MSSDPLWFAFAVHLMVRDIACNFILQIMKNVLYKVIVQLFPLLYLFSYYVNLLFCETA